MYEFQHHNMKEFNSNINTCYEVFVGCFEVLQSLNLPLIGWAKLTRFHRSKFGNKFCCSVVLNILRVQGTKNCQPPPHLFSNKGISSDSPPLPSFLAIISINKNLASNQKEEDEEERNAKHLGFIIQLAIIQEEHPIKKNHSTSNSCILQNHHQVPLQNKCLHPH